MTENPLLMGRVIYRCMHIMHACGFYCKHAQVCSHTCRCDAARVQALVVAMASQGKPFPPCHTSITAAVQQPTIAPSGSGEAAALPACKEGQDKGCCTEGVDACTAGASADVGMAVPPASIVLPHGPRPCSVMSTASDATDSSMPDGWFRHGV